MQHPPPPTLIQLHYHNRPGGVTTVMRQYARAFARIHAKTGACIVTACHASGAGESGVRLVDIPAMEYREFVSRRAFVNARDTGLHALHRVLDEADGGGPVWVLGHNLTLGKNCAVSAAFAELARECEASRRNLRFISVVHDLAEEGRAAQLAQIRRLERLGVPIWRSLYPQTRNLRYWVLNPRNLRLLRAAGLATELLPNPVEVRPGRSPLSKAQRQHVRDALCQLAGCDGIVFRSNRPILLYAARLIQRKNIVEALLAAVLLDVNLVLGSPGPSPADVRWHRRLLRLCRELAIPVVFDGARIGPAMGTGGDAPAAFRLLYRCADACISTSLAEGFGYALFEPWLYGKPLVGRIPAGFGGRGWPLPLGAYRRLPVPAEWLDLDALTHAYSVEVRRCFGKTGTPRRWASELVVRGGVDFGALDVGLQMQVLRRVCALACTCGPVAPADVGALNRLRRAFDRGRHCPDAVAANRRLVEREFGVRAFDGRLAARLTSAARRSAARPELDLPRIRRYFAQARHFRLLLSPGARP